MIPIQELKLRWQYKSEERKLEERKLEERREKRENWKREERRKRLSEHSHTRTLHTP
jgi:hypothetical protein